MSATQKCIVGLGEVLWDLLPDGAKFGGAPANFACHARQLGAAAHVVSAVGNDELGTQALAELMQRQVATKAISRNDHPTGTVVVTLDENGSPSYDITRDVAWDHIAWSDAVREIAATTDAACFGTLCQRSADSRRTIRHFLEAMPPDALRIFDINLRPPFYDEPVILESLALANVFKLSDEELGEVAAICNMRGDEVSRLRQLAERFELRAVALTCGSRGAILLRGDEVSQHPAVETDVADTIGAGDSFTAALAVGLLAGHGLDSINAHACRVAAFVCSQSGATPTFPAELAAAGAQ